MKGIIDRFEGDIVVLEMEGKTKDFKRDMFPKNASAGDIVEMKDGKFIIKKEETKKLRAEIQDLMDELFEE